MKSLAQNKHSTVFIFSDRKMERKLRINELKMKVYFVVFKNEMEIVSNSKSNTINLQNTSLTINLFISLNKVDMRYLKNFCDSYN